MARYQTTSGRSSSLRASHGERKGFTGKHSTVSQKKNKRLLAVYLVGDGTANFVKTDYQIVLSSCDGYSAEEQLTNARFYYYIFNPLSPESDEQQSSPWNTIFLHIGDEN